MDNNSGHGGSKSAWPLDRIQNEPKPMAEFLLGLGYHPDRVLNTLIERCKLSLTDAQQIISQVQQGGPPND